MSANRFLSLKDEEVVFTHSIDINPATTEKRTGDKPSSKAAGSKKPSTKKEGNTTKPPAGLDGKPLTSLDIVSLALKKKEEERKRLEEEKRAKAEELERKEQEKKLAAERKHQEDKAYDASLPEPSQEENQYKNNRAYARHHREHVRQMHDSIATPRQYHRAHDRENRSGHNSSVPEKKSFSNSKGENINRIAREETESIRAAETSPVMELASTENKENAASVQKSASLFLPASQVLTLAQYLAEKSKNALKIETATRLPNEGVDSGKWDKSVPLVKAEEALFLSATKKTALKPLNSAKFVQTGASMPKVSLDPRLNIDVSKPSATSSTRKARN